MLPYRRRSSRFVTNLQFSKRTRRVACASTAATGSCGLCCTDVGPVGGDVSRWFSPTPFSVGKVVIVLDRPRHEKLIEEIRTAGARIRLIGDGDLSAGISAAVLGTGVHAVMGTGGAPEGVLTAAALRCLNGQILARLVVSKKEHAERLEKMGVTDLKRVYDTEDLAPGKKMIFACTGVTDGNLLKGVRFFDEGVRTSSMILTLDERQVRFIDSVHLENRPDIKVRFN